MPRKQTVDRARSAKRQGKAPSTQAGEYVREEMDKMEEGGTRAPRSRTQAIAIGLSMARRDGVKVGGGARKRTARKTRKASSTTTSRKASSAKTSTRKTSSRKAAGSSSTRTRTRKATRKTSSRKRTSAKRTSR